MCNSPSIFVNKSYILRSIENIKFCRDVLCLSDFSQAFQSNLYGELQKIMKSGCQDSQVTNR